MALFLTVLAFLFLTQSAKSMQARLLAYSSASAVTPLEVYSETTTESKTVGAAEAYGPYTWLLHTASTFVYARVTPGFRQVFDPTLSVNKFQIEETVCTSRYKGVESVVIIPDSAFIGMTSYEATLPPSRIRLTEYGSGWPMKVLPSWVAIDLGTNFRLFKILTKGGAYSGSYTGPYTYQLHYRLAGSEYVTYQENSTARIFTSHSASTTWSTEITNQLANPIIGQIFKIEVLTGVAVKPIIKAELIGCDCEPGPEVPVFINKPGQGHLTAAPEVSDGDTSTCLTVEQHSPVTVFIPMPVIISDNMTVTTRSKRDPSCPMYDPQELYPMWKLTPPFRSQNGIFKKCQFLENYLESELNIQVFNCTCSLGVCEGVSMRVNPPCTVQLCDVNLN